MIPARNTFADDLRATVVPDALKKAGYRDADGKTERCFACEKADVQRCGIKTEVECLRFKLPVQFGYVCDWFVRHPKLTEKIP